MRVQAILWDRYRLFKNFQKPTIAPVTIMIGKNGSGKSVISRLPLLLSEALSVNADGPLSLTSGGIDHAESFQDFVHQRGALPFTVGLQIGNSDARLTFATSLRYVHETRSLAIERFVLERDGSTISLKLHAPEQLGTDRPSFEVEVLGEARGHLNVAFNGLFPVAADLTGELADQIEAAQASFQDALPIPSYLGPFREEPSRGGKMPSQAIRSLGSRGERAAELLADDQLRRGGKLAAAVSRWFGSAMNHSLEIDLSHDQPRLVIANMQNRTSVSLADTGAGFAQVLPIAVQHFAYRLGRIDTRTLIVEQPELHLHPAAHGPVADLINETASGGNDWPPATCLVETHSEQFITRLRRRVAEGQPADTVRILSLDHVDSAARDEPAEPLREIALDSNGDPDAWPAGVFEEALDDLTAMRRTTRA